METLVSKVNAMPLTGGNECKAFDKVSLMLTVIIEEYIKTISLKVREKECVIMGHGSTLGGFITINEYFDPYECEWTTRSRAIQGHVFKFISKHIPQQTNFQ